MIPDIALMIVVYGSARLITAVLDPHRKGTGPTMPNVATGLSWVVAAGAIIALAVLGIDVLGQSSTALPGLTQ